MGLLARLFGREAKGAGPLDIFREIYGGRPSKTGKSVTVKTALEVTTVLACARVLADGVAQVPWKLMREAADGRSRLPATDHPLYDVLHRRPNPWQTSYELRETMMFHLALCGNFFAFKNVVGGTVRELLPFEPGRVTVEEPVLSGRPSYRVTLVDGRQVPIPAEAMWHARGPSWNGWMGLEATRLAREAIGLAIATEESQADLHRNGVSPSGVYSVEGNLSPEQYERLRAHLEKEHASEKQKPFILDRSAKWQSLAMSGVDAQHIETRRFQVEEMCRVWRVMPIMVGFADKTATYASAEQMFLAHVVHTLTPWYERIEQSADVNLLSEADREAGLYTNFVEQGLLRGALKDTAEYLTKLTTNGVMTRNEARGKLDLNPLDGLDEPLTPANMIVGAVPPEPEPRPPGSEGSDG